MSQNYNDGRVTCPTLLHAIHTTPLATHDLHKALINIPLCGNQGLCSDWAQQFKPNKDDCHIQPHQDSDGRCIGYNNNEVSGRTTCAMTYECHYKALPIHAPDFGEEKKTNFKIGHS